VERQRFNRRIWTAAVVSAAFFVPLCIFGAPALARSAASASQYEYGGSSQYQYKVTLCHKTHSKKHPYHQITVSSHAVNAHLKHGDTVGTCPTTPPAPTTGNNHGHDDGNDNGKHGNGDDNNQGNGGDHGNNGNGNGNGNGHGNGGGKGHH
jgi:uncharacterized membrane protein YgcG